VLLKTIRDISHKKDSGDDATTILDLVRMDKDMFLVHQAPTKLLLSYLLKFKGVVDVVDSSDGSPWSHPAATKIIFDESNNPADLTLAKASNSSQYQMAATEAKWRYLAAQFFHGLSNKAHGDLKKKIHNDALTGSDTVPRTYDKVLQLADLYKSSYQQRNPGSDRGGVLAFAQKGKAAAAEASATAAAAVKDASTERQPHPVPGEKDSKGKMLTNSAGKKNCFNCGANNHWVINCPDLTNAQHDELAGMVHISIGDT
jgi:hypothetical protein